MLSRTRTNSKNSIFWDITPCSLLKVNRCFGGTFRPHHQVRNINQTRTQRESRWQAELVSYLAYSSILKMEAICTSEMPVDFQHTTRRYIPENRTLPNHRCENLKSYKYELILHEAINCWTKT
jgi:hypothetical protein